MTKGQEFVLTLNAYITARLNFDKNPGGAKEELAMYEAEEVLADTVDRMLNR